MRRKTYRALVIFAVIVVVLAVALAFGVRFHQKTGNDSISTDYQKPDDSIQDIEPEPESVKDYPSESVEKGANMEDSEDEFKSISDQIEQLNRRIQAIRKSEGSDEERQERLRQIQATIDERSAHRDAYDDSIVRQMIECIKVYKGGKLKIIFGGAYEVEEQI